MSRATGSASAAGWITRTILPARPWNASSEGGSGHEVGSGIGTSFACANAARSSHSRTLRTTASPCSPNSLARLGQPVTFLPSSSFWTAGIVFFARAYASSSWAAVATASMNVDTCFRTDPARTSPPARAIAAVSLEPFAGQYLASNAAAATARTARRNSASCIAAGLVNVCQAIASPVSLWVLGG